MKAQTRAVLEPSSSTQASAAAFRHVHVHLSFSPNHHCTQYLTQAQRIPSYPCKAPAVVCWLSCCHWRSTFHAHSTHFLRFLAHSPACLTHSGELQLPQFKHIQTILVLCAAESFSLLTQWQAASRTDTPEFGCRTTAAPTCHFRHAVSCMVNVHRPCCDHLPGTQTVRLA